jgi:type I restriction enzyme, S subunit
MVATEELMSNFDAVITPIFSQLAVLNRKNRNLRTTRDMLLPKLVSGEVSVENLEKEAVAHMV